MSLTTSKAAKQWRTPPSELFMKGFAGTITEIARTGLSFAFAAIFLRRRLQQLHLRAAARLLQKFYFKQRLKRRDKSGGAGGPARSHFSEEPLIWVPHSALLLRRVAHGQRLSLNKQTKGRVPPGPLSLSGRTLYWVAHSAIFWRGGDLQRERRNHWIKKQIPRRPGSPRDDNPVVSC